MSIVAQKPAASLFGYEVGDDINKNKSLLKQCTEALVANGVPVTLPPGFMTPDLTAPKSGTPYDVELQWVKNLQTAMNGAKALLTLFDATPTGLIQVTAKVAGVAGNVITVAVAAGSVSGKKITVTDGVTPEVYDDLADVDAAIAAMAASLLVDVTKLANGTLENISATNLVGGVAYTAPSFALGENDNQSIFIAKWAKALFDALRTYGYIA